MTGTYLLALALTVLVECLLALALARRSERPRLVTVTFFLNLFTHPLANLAHGEGIPFVAVEAAVFLVEAAGFRIVAGCTWRRAAALSLVLNGVTAVLSFVF